MQTRATHKQPTRMQRVESTIKTGFTNVEVHFLPEEVLINRTFEWLAYGALHVKSLFYDHVIYCLAMCSRFVSWRVIMFWLFKRRNKEQCSTSVNSWDTVDICVALTDITGEFQHIWGTYFDNATYEYVITLVIDPVFQHYFVHHRNEDLVLKIK